MATNRFPHLMSPGCIGALTLKNRIVVTAMGVSLAEEDGTAGERLGAYHEEQARGGAGLIILGVTGVASPFGNVCLAQTGISEDRFIPGLAALCRRVQAHGAKIAAQLHHGGPNAQIAAAFGHPYAVPSIPKPPEGDVGGYLLIEEQGEGDGAQGGAEFEVLDQAGIDLAVSQFRDGATRAVKAGFDAVEIHAGHGYLLSAFISPNTNRRTDRYGGTLENRMRLTLEVLAAVREAVGPEFPVWVKLDSREEGIAAGITIDDAVEAAKMLEVGGADAITVTAYHNNAVAKLHSGSHTPHDEALNLPYAARIRSALSIPVIASGRVEPGEGDRAIANGEADFIAMGRKLLADPHLPNKLASGEPDQVRPCIYCYTCISAIYLGQPVRCAVNPELAREFERMNAHAGRFHFAVIGGGPGGMEAARRLDAEGHRVTLIERAPRLGGTLRFAGLAYEPNERLLKWLTRQVRGSAVEVRLNTEATPELLSSLAVDGVIVATGAVRGMPPIPGNDLDHVFSGDDMRAMMFGDSSAALKRKTMMLTRLITGVGGMTGATSNLGLVRKASHVWMPLGDRVVIIGGELVGIELAEFLHERGRKVTVIEEGPRLGKGLTFVRRMRVLEELDEHGVALHAGASDIAIDRESVRFMDRDGASRSVRADTVIVAKGAAGDTSLAERLRAAGFRVRTIGDANGVGYIEGAMRSAMDAVTALLRDCRLAA